MQSWSPVLYSWITVDPRQVFICPQLHSMFCVIYQLCRVRGAKAVVRLMPHEASELEPVLHALQAQVKRMPSLLRSLV